MGGGMRTMAEKNIIHRSSTGQQAPPRSLNVKHVVSKKNNELFQQISNASHEPNYFTHPS